MKIIRKIEEIQQMAKKGIRGFVPTMGCLHEGHLSLMRQARAECDELVASIFVNPLQFGPNEDYDRYPRRFEADRALAEQCGVDVLFCPDNAEMYPTQALTKVVVPDLSTSLCGVIRPHFFAGVATVVAKLFHIVQPDRAYFGMKDAQQVAVIQQMVRDLHFPLTIVPCQTVREADGLAMSSRNHYLTPEQLHQAPVIYKALQAAKQCASPAEIKVFIRDFIVKNSNAEVEYVEVRSYPLLEEIERFTNERTLVAVAVRFEETRLIDNVLIEGKGWDRYVALHDEVQNP